MATLTPGLFTYSEWALRMDPDGKTSVLVDLMSQNNGILEDCLAVECTSGNAFEFTQVVGLPKPSRRVYNQGVPFNNGSVAKQIQTAVEYFDWSQIDSSLAELGGNLAQLRFQEDALHLEALSQLVASDLFYGNRASDPTQFTGFANIYNTVNTATSQIANNVIDCGGTGNTNASMWLVTWGPKHIHTIFPKGTMAGMRHRDMGLLPKVDANSNEYLAYRTQIDWKIGLAIHDWRYCVRAANIDVSLLSGGNAANLIAILNAMVYKPPVMPAGVAPVQTTDSLVDKVVMGRSAIYVNRTVNQALDLQAQNKTNVLLKMEQWDTQPVLTYRGIPIRVVDALTSTESRVV